MEVKKNFSGRMAGFGRRTSAFIEENRLRTVNSGLETDIIELYREAGEKAFALWRQGSLEAEELTPAFMEIQEKLNQVRKNQARIQKVQKGYREEGRTKAAPAAEKVIYVPPKETEAHTENEVKEPNPSKAPQIEKTQEPAWREAVPIQEPVQKEATQGQESVWKGTVPIQEPVQKEAAQEQKPVQAETAQGKDNSDEVGEWASLERIFCPNCGISYPLTANFCRRCGTRLH